MGKNQSLSWLSQNWNYILGGSIFLAFVYYDSSLPKEVSASNETLYLLTVLPAFMYFVVLHPLFRDSEKTK